MTALTPSREEWLALANEIEESVGLLRMMPARGGTRSLGIKKTAQVIAALRLAAKPSDEGVRQALEDRQHIVIEWGERCFGADHMKDKIVRAARFLEEAAELAQAAGLARDHAQRAFDHVYSRQPGDPAQEVGGTANTLMALCGTLGLSFDDCQRAEIKRCLAKDPSHFAKRNEAKLREVDASTTGEPKR